MCTKEGITLNSIFSTVYRTASENSKFLKNFAEQSKDGRDEKIIEIIRRIPELENLSIKESYRAKNNDQAENFLKEADRAENDQEKLILLTKAVFAAELTDDGKKLFLDALMRRIHLSFASENLNKCLKYSRYMMSILNEGVSPDLKETEHHMYKIECLSYEIRCLKALGVSSSDSVKVLARKGIQEAKSLFQMMEDKGIEMSNKEKLDSLAPFLHILNDNKSDIQEKLCNQIIEARRSAVTKSTRTTEASPVPEVLGKRSKELNSCSDAVALKYNVERGRHLVATRNIKIGSVLIIDEPFAWSTDAEMLESNCLHCHVSLALPESVKIPCRSCQTVNFCSENCRRESWDNYHRWECSIFDCFVQTLENQAKSSRLLLAYRTTVRLATEKMETDGKCRILSPELAKYYSNNNNSGDDKKTLEIELGENYDGLDYRTVYSLERNSKFIDPLLNLSHGINAVILAKCFKFVLSKNIKKEEGKGEIKIEDEDEREHVLAVATLRHLQAINANAYEIVENVLDKQSKVWEPKTIGGAIYPTVSLTNHSCNPNIIRHTYPRGKVVVRAISFIQKGKEIFDCYGPHYLRDTKTKRQEYLFEKYNFNCTCEACNNDLKPSNLTAITTSQPQLYKCRNCRCEISQNSSKNSCLNCGAKIDRIKTDKTVEESMKCRSFAIQKMIDGDHASALPVLLRHAELVDQIFPDYNFEAVKTQQALVQCYNSMGCISE